MEKSVSENRLGEFFEDMQMSDENMLYRSILDGMQTAIYVRDFKSYELIYLNRRAREIFGMDEGETLAEQKCYVRFHHQNAACRDCPARLRNIEQTAPQEKMIDGRIYATRGKVIDWCGREAYIEYLIDVTDTKQVSEQLRLTNESLEKKYEEMLLYREKAITDDVLSACRVNLTQGIIEEMTVGGAKGYERSYRRRMNYVEQLGAFAMDVWLTDEQNAMLSREGLLAAYARGENKVSVEYVAELMSGYHVWVRGEASVVRHPRTDEILAFIYNREVTGNRLLLHVLECLMSYEYDEIYVVDSVNGTFHAIAIGEYAIEGQRQGGSYQDELATLMERAPLEEDRGRLREELSIEFLHRCLMKENAHELEVSLISKNGRARLKQIRCMYLNSQIGMFLITITDIDEMVRAERRKQELLSVALNQARDASRAKSQFLASMSHEIRTPMNAIIGLNTIIKQDIDNRDQILDCSEKLDSASKYLLALLNDILDVSRIESGNMTLAHQPFDGEKFWENVNILARMQAEIKSVTYLFEWKREENRTYVGDETRFKQIIINLINNAIKFTSEEGYVKVTVEEEKPADGRVAVRIAIEDNGIGISEEFLPQLFDTFTQEHIGSTTSYQGSGLGLSIARNFARMMDGDITVKSTLGKGTTFWVSVVLDVDENSHAKVQETAEVAVETDFTGVNILLAEDHPLNAIVAKNLLSRRGMNVVHAENGEEVLRFFLESEEGSFDAILMDVRMPLMDGIEAARRIRAMKREDAAEIPIIAMTANAYEEDRKLTADAGMDAHLAKPIDPEQLFLTLGRLIRQHLRNK